MLKTREHVIYHKLPYFSLKLGENLGKTWESIFSQVPFETSLLSSKKKVNFTCFFDLGKIVLSQILKKCIPKNRLKTCIFVCIQGLENNYIY